MNARQIIEVEDPKHILGQMRSTPRIPSDTKNYFLQFGPVAELWDKAELAPISVYDDGQVALTDGLYTLTGVVSRWAGGDEDLYVRAMREYHDPMLISLKRGETEGTVDGEVGAYKWRLLRRDQGGDWSTIPANSTPVKAIPRQEAEDPKQIFAKLPRSEPVTFKDVAIDERPDAEYEEMRFCAVWATPFIIAHRPYLRGCPAGTGRSMWSAIRDLVDSTNKESKTKFYFNFASGHTTRPPQQEAEDPKEFIQHMAPRDIIVHCYMGKWVVNARNGFVKRWRPDSNVTADRDFAAWAETRTAFDFDEWEKHYGRMLDMEIDICDVGSWGVTGSYTPAEDEWRKENAGSMAEACRTFEAEDPKSFLRHRVPELFTVQCFMGKWRADAQTGRIVQWLPYDSAEDDPDFARWAADRSAFDVGEWQEHYGRSVDISSNISICDIGSWDTKGKYAPADSIWRKENAGNVNEARKLVEVESPKHFIRSVAPPRFVLAASDFIWPEDFVNALWQLNLIEYPMAQLVTPELWRARLPILIVNDHRKLTLRNEIVKDWPGLLRRLGQPEDLAQISMVLDTSQYTPENAENVNEARTSARVLLDGLPGVDQQTLDEIMGVILGVVDRVESGNPQVDCQRFEQEVNPLLARWGITFVSNDVDLQKYYAPGKAGVDGITMATPWRISRNEFDHTREVLSHELVHGDQLGRAMTAGNVAKMAKSSHDRMMSGGELDYEKYYSDPHEVTAYARTAIDKMRRKKMTRSQVLQSLRTQPLTYSGYASDKTHKRFLKRAAGYAQQLPEAEDPKQFLQRQAPRFEVQGHKNVYAVSSTGQVISVTATGPRSSLVPQGPRPPRRVVKFDVGEYEKRYGEPPSGTIPISQISYWTRSGKYYASIRRYPR